METRWLKRKNENDEEEKFYPITHSKAIVCDDGTVTLDEKINTLDENISNLTAEDVDAIPVIDACSADFDMDAIFTGGAHCAFYLTDENTLNTPKALGVSTYNKALILSYSGSSGYGKQMAFTSGGNYVLFRTLNDNGTISNWSSEFLPLSGGTMTGSIALGNGYGRVGSSSTLSRLEHYAAQNDENNRCLVYLCAANALETKLRFRNYVEGEYTNYTVYGTHNVTKGTTALTAGTDALATNCIYYQYE